MLASIATNLTDLFLKLLVSLFLFFVVCNVAAQDKKQITAIRISDPPKIDGRLDDPVWKEIEASNNFYMWQPGNEGNIPENRKTEVKIAYDDKAVYVAAYMYDPEPDKIASQFSQRDNIFVQADHFMVALNTYNDGINETQFYITSAGTIGDAITSQNGTDFSYNVVFDGKTQKDDQGWYAEFRIPYNALRFPEIAIQNWSINFYRRIISENQTHSWSFIDNKIGNPTQYNGLVTGVRDINTPLRLTLFPFVQGLVTTIDGETESEFSAGMDLKYGLSDSFTLDATLIPDFGQASFDEISLNLGPFEQTFDENRQFFTEGIDLFNKGRIFFSRRVGNAPTGSVDDLDDHEIIEEMPSRVNLLNALKISGRTKKKLGIGFFNAITEKTYATVKDTLSLTKREVLVEPLANYNIFVIDQQFNNNSSVSLINTNVTRNGHFRDGNVTGLVFDVADRKNTVRASGRAIFSNVNLPEGTQNGFMSELDLIKTKGNFRYRVGHDFANTRLDINDLGLNFRNNFNNFVAGAWYQIFEPTDKFNTYRIGLTARHRRLYKPSVETGNIINLNAFFVKPSRFAFGGNVNYHTENKDYFEARTEGRFVLFEPHLGGNVWVSSDYRKKFAYDIRLGHRQWFKEYFNENRANYFLNISPRYRFSDKFLVILESEWFTRKNHVGYIDSNETDIYLGLRDIKSVEHTISGSYNFDPYKAINLSFRNFWSTASYPKNQFYTLNQDGSRSVTTYDLSENNPNTNFNIWNLDLSFRWRYAPGSEATFLYRNQIFNSDTQSTLNYSESLRNLFKQPTQHTLSLRIVYFLDVNNLKKAFKG